MKSIVFSGLIAVTVLSAGFSAETPQQEAPPPQATCHGVGHKLLFYVPNRIFDVLDIVRARVRVGPGLAVGARVTKLTDIFLGSYAAVFVGLPGPRQAPCVPWPAGIESRTGLAASVADATVTTKESNPRYADTEVGLGAHVVVLGAEVGVDPVEAFDLVIGLLFLDPRGDDL
jgi:hypothetical protein